MKTLRILWALLVTTMMDRETLFSNDQAITASAASTDKYDQGNAQGDGSGRVLKITVTETFATLTSLTFQLRHDTASDMGTAVVALATPAIAAASLVAGADFEIPLPKGLNRYLDVNYVVGGSNATAGKIKAGIVINNDSDYAAA